MIPTSVRIFLTVVVLALGLGAVLGVRAGLMESQQTEVESVDVPEVDDGAVRRLSEAVQIETISPDDYDADELGPYQKFRASLIKWFPETHSALEREAIGPCSLVYTWEGRDSELQPAVWLSHMDVVPADSPDEWTHAPFSGRVADGYIWGRGTLDVKSGLIGILEATETLVKTGYTPERTVKYAFGCDEEVGGERGAKQIAAAFAEREVEPSYVLDEGHAITEKLVPGLDRPVALVGLSEKGYATFELTATGEGGHSSMPPTTTAIGELSDAIDRVEARPMPARLNEPARRMFETLGPELPFHQQLVFANLWLFDGLVVRQMEGKPSTNASVRTTSAVTTVRGGSKENVLPGRATATVNFRIAPGDTIEDAEDHLERVVDDDIEVSRPESAFGSNPSPVSETDTDAYRAVERNVRAVFGEKTAVAPALTVGATDSRYYTDVAENVYRFLPIILGPEDTERIHGVDERISVDNYRAMVRFYMAMLREM